MSSSKSLLLPGSRILNKSLKGQSKKSQSITIKNSLCKVKGTRLRNTALNTNNPSNTLEDAVDSVLEPICVLKASSSKVKRTVSSVNKGIHILTEEDKLSFKAHDDTNCYVCSIEFGDFELLQQHLIETRFFCRVCTKDFDNHFDLDDHFTKHKCYKCKNCCQVFFCRKDHIKHLKVNELCGKTIEKLKCEVCDKTFARQRILKRHKMQAHSSGTGMFDCVVCGKFFNLPHLLSDHLIAVHVAYEYTECKICHSLLLGPRKLKIHMRTKHFEPMENSCFVCDVCSKVFAKEVFLRQHLDTHDLTGSLCELCGKSVTGGRSGMLRHKRWEHSKSSSFTCEICNNVFDSMSKYTYHKQKHYKDQNEKPKFCELCGKKFKNSSVLKRHLLVHSEERAFQCDVCGASFKQKVALYTHSRVHSETNKYACDSCAQTFRWKQTFDKHVKKCGSPRTADAFQ